MMEDDSIDLLYDKTCIKFLTRANKNTNLNQVENICTLSKKHVDMKQETLDIALEIGLEGSLRCINWD